MKVWDVIIVGGGIIGLSLSIALRKRGRTVLIVERSEPGLEASHAAAGMLADTMVESPKDLQTIASQSARMYPEFAHELQDESGIRVDLRDHGTIVISTDEENSENTGDQLTQSELVQLEPKLSHFYGYAIYSKQRSVDPRGLVAAALKAAKHRGVDISSGSNVVDVTVSNGSLGGVLTDKTQYAASVVVNCAGAWSGQFGPVRFPTRPVKGQMLSLAAPNVLQHVIHSSEVYLVPRSDGRLLVGATVEEAGFDKRTVPETIHRMHEAALRLVPTLRDARIVEDWAGLRPGSPDDLPILGSTKTQGYFVATGHFRDGILLAPVTAHLMAQLISGEALDYDIAAFSPARFDL